MLSPPLVAVGGARGIASLGIGAWAAVSMPARKTEWPLGGHRVAALAVREAGPALVQWCTCAGEGAPRWTVHLRHRVDPFADHCWRVLRVVVGVPEPDRVPQGHVWDQFVP